MTAVAQLTLPTVPTWEPALPIDAVEQSVLSALRDGSRHTRAELVQHALVPDRTVRAAIEGLRRAD